MTLIWTNDLAQEEDGLRIESLSDTIEWWYFDTVLDDGSTCVVTFMSAGTQPSLQFNISPPGGGYYQEVIPIPADQYQAASDHCRVVMGASSVEGNLTTYSLRVVGEQIAADLTLTGSVPGWRVGPYLPPDQAIHVPLGEQVVIPSGTVLGSLTYDGVEHPVTGTCYHDHQWGGPPSRAKAGGVVPTSWYWGSVRLGDHAAWFAQILGSDGGPPAPIEGVFTWARGAHMTYDDDVNALAITPQPDGGIEVVWTSSLGGVTVALPSPRQIASLNDGKYTRFLSPAVVISNYAGEQFRRDGNAIWEINLLTSARR